MRRLLITESATTTIDYSRSYVLLLADGETAADLAEIAEVEWVRESERFDVWDDLTTFEDASESDLGKYEVVGADLDAINATLQQIAAEEQPLDSEVEQVLVRREVANG